jgi:hypothetical protein
MATASYRRLLTIWLSDYGRTNGWLIERCGLPLGMLYDRVSAEMFWDRYRVGQLSDCNAGSEEVYSERFWREFDFASVKFRSIAVGEIAENAIPSLIPFDAEGRVSIRGLYIAARAPNAFDKFILFLCRHLRRKQPDSGDE